jgi:hypothetical protein
MAMKSKVVAAPSSAMDVGAAFRIEGNEVFFRIVARVTAIPSVMDFRVDIVAHD